MVERIISFSINNKMIIGLFVIGLIIWSIFSLYNLPVDAVPDITNNQVQVISIAPTLAANEVEQFISSPVEIALANIPGIVELRSISRLGLSVVTVVFKDNIDTWWARQQISEHLEEAIDRIPYGVAKPELAPVSTGLSEIYQYILHVKDGYKDKYNLLDLRTIQDWIVRREMLGTPGVADVNSYGGFLKQYEISVNPQKLRSMNITLTEIFEALDKNNQNTGSAYIDKKPNAYFIRGLGLISSMEDIGEIMIKTVANGIPVHMSDVANVHIGHAPRYGALVVDTTGEAVGGVVMMLKGKNASQVINGVKERIKMIEKTLPEGVEIIPYLDRTDLVDRAIGTVTRNLIEGGLIVIFVLVLLLGNLRAGLIVASVIPLSMMFAFSLMKLFNVSGNLMSLGAIDFGLIVDGAVIIVESVLQRIRQSITHRTGIKELTHAQMDSEVLGSANRMMRSATFGQVIILIVYLPILALVGIEGKMFRPMAETVGFAILGALILSLTYVPVASALFLGRKIVHKTNISDRIMNNIHKVFSPLLNYSLKHKITVIFVSVLLFVASLFLFNKLGGEFIPTLEEGDLASGIITLQGGSLSYTIEAAEKANKILMNKFPEVKHAICKIGTGEIPTDPTPMETGDYIIVMKDKKEWTSAKTREEMMAKMQEELSVLKGVIFTLQQPIQMRFNELMTGSKQDVAVKIFGDNLDVLMQKAVETEKLIHTVPGAEDVNVDKVTGSGQVQVKYDRKKIARYGLNISDVNTLLKMAFAGCTAGTIFEEEKRFDLVVRFDEKFRNDIDYVKKLYVPLPDGGQVTLDQLASIDIRNGTAQISRESTRRRITVSFNVRGRDVESIISELRTKIESKLKLPPGYYITYGGQFENLVAAKERLSIAVPFALLLIFILLFFTFRSVRNSLLIFSAVPLSAIGGVFALYLRDMNFSISAGVGFIALFGVSVLNGIVLISEFNRLGREEGIYDIYERVRKGIKIRLRPVIITAAVASLGFLPMAISTSPGSEVQKPLATVVIGGLISSSLLTLIILPVLYIIFSSGKKLMWCKPGKSMITTTIIFVILISSVFINKATAQENITLVYTLEQAINRALSENGYIKSAELHVEMQKKLKTAAWETTSTDFGYIYGQTNSILRDNNFSITQSFRFPGINKTKLRLGDANIRYSEAGMLLSRAEVISEVKITYFNVLYINSLISLLGYRDSLFTEFARAAELKVQNGESPPLEKAAAQTRLMEVRSLVRQAEADLLIYQRKMQLLLNEKKPVSIFDKELKKTDISISNDSSALAGNALIEMFRQQAEMSRIETIIEKLKLLPEFSLGYFNQSNREINPYMRFTGVQAGLSVPLIFFPKTAKVQSLIINEKIAHVNYEYNRAKIFSQYNESVQEYLKKKARLEYYEESAIPQADLIIGQSEKSFKAGNIDYVEFIFTINQAMEIKAGYLHTLLEYNMTIIAIEKLTCKIN